MAIKTVTISSANLVYKGNSAGNSSYDSSAFGRGDITNIFDKNEGTLSAIGCYSNTSYTYYGHFKLVFAGITANCKITDISVKIVLTRYKSGANTKFRLCSSLASDGTYADCGDGAINADLSSTGKKTYTFTASNLPNTFSWLKNNVASVAAGEFGVRFEAKMTQLYEFEITLTYEEPEHYTVSTAVSPTGAGTVTPTTQTVEEGSTATVTATPNAGYKFSHWLLNGADSGVTTPTLSGTITENITCTAVFVLDKINKIYVGTAQPKAIYVGTQEVKAIYVGTTKVYG